MRNSFLAVLLALLAFPLQAADWVDKLEQEKREQSGVAITILFDDSGSMGGPVPGTAGSKMDAAKAAFMEWIKQVPDHYRLGLIALNAGELVKLETNNKFAMMSAVQNMRPNGGTPLAMNLDRINTRIQARRKAVGPYERQIVVAFTDGEDNTTAGIEGVKQALANLKKEQVESVGIGFGGQGDYMRGVSTQYFDANSKEELLTSLMKVDSEIGNTNDIRISPEVREAMAHVNMAPPPKPEPAPEPVAPEAVTHILPPKRSRGWFVAIIFVGALVLAVFKFAMRAKRY